MPPLHGFSNNPLKTHQDFKIACVSLLRALKQYQSPGGARIKLSLATGTHFDDIAAQLEGFARPLWAIGSLVHGFSLTPQETEEIVEPYVRGLANGTDPNHEEYWGPVVVRDQRMVEMEIISFALLAAPETLYHNQTPEAKYNIKSWLATLNGKDFPVTNWLWFRVMTNLALVRVCGVPYEEVKRLMEVDLDQMEQFYLNEGWAADGIWNEHGRQADYYSGSFAIQFSQLLYIKYASDLDPTRCSKFRDRAAEFATSFWRYFDSNGAAIPFGRSLTYRFAFAGFWSAAAFAEVILPAPINDWGVVKGLLLRHFRWWSDKHDMFNIDGTLTIGFTYPNMYMSEDYNSPQSPYWCMKSFVTLGLPPSHAFWTAEERPLPLPAKPTNVTAIISPPKHIISNTGNHHFLLSAGQFCPWPLKATEAKYGKYAYSSHFGFSVPTGSSVLAQMAPDSTLALSKDDGDTYKVPWKVHRYSIDEALLVNCEQGTKEKVPVLKSLWSPWKDAKVEVETTLIPPCGEWPDWHIRVHRVIDRGESRITIRAVEGGFAIQGRGAKAGEVLPAHNSATDFIKNYRGHFEGTLQLPNGALICSNAGASGIRPVSFYTMQSQVLFGGVQCEAFKPDANTNLIWQRTLIPTLKLEVMPLSGGQIATFASGVFAISRRSGAEESYDELDIKARWEKVPTIVEEGCEAPIDGQYIAVKFD